MNSRIYQGEVSHARLEPVRHQFRYPVYFYAFDLDELPGLAKENPLFGYNRLRPVAVHDRDYLTPGEEPIRTKLANLLRQLGQGMELGRVVLVTAARYFNYVFNPASFFYCHDPEGRLACVLVQVNNTFGEMHLYLLAGETVLQSGVQKVFHVSPFFPRRGRYEFHLTPPGENIDNTIRYFQDDRLSLVARIQGQARPLTPGSLARTVASHPLCASLTMPRILWQAARLYWQRRLPVYHKPVPESALTIRPVPAGLLDRLGEKMVLRFLSRLPQGRLLLTTPDRREFRFGSGEDTPLRMQIREPRFFRRVMLHGDVGFGESYTDGDWTTPDLPEVLTLLAANEEAMDDRSLATAAAGRLVNYVRHLRRPNTVRGSSRNIREHYDLSNDFFSILLDPTMTYSCGIFEQETDSLEQSQKNKLRTMIRKAGITAADHVLEIGCGWGGFALEAVRQTGCRVTGITVSREQLDFALQRVREAGLEDRIDLRLCDYRHIEGTYSKIVSIEMLEAVGHAGLGPFFAACDRALAPGGRAAIQVITIADRKYETYRTSSDWIRKHIFPGGHVPSPGAISAAVRNHSSLAIEEVENYGRHYARTLDIWRRTLLKRQGEIHALGFDDSFVRKWDYYFAYCQAGFTAGLIDLAQFVLNKPNRG
ncbi:DUF1365 family protein [Desulfuromonas sp. AOP6]|uniref:DUF1365 family protein n=1 Tax=Desulfuromonas sp. AOP6 TaxID=1566351 RepID=UPI0012894150|nr:DUF1365 family protein [Desulfuromonas sp. AOP6]BCA79298.1 hypothetical protein AOP6_1085 [Desulfuromonas sp. AOP6]